MITHLTSYRPTISSISKGFAQKLLEKHPNLDLAKSVLKDTFFTKRLRSPKALDRFLQNPNEATAKISGSVFENATEFNNSIAIPEGKTLLLQGKKNFNGLNVLVQGRLRAFDSSFDKILVEKKAKAIFSGANLLTNKGAVITTGFVKTVRNRAGAIGRFLGGINILTNDGTANCYEKVLIAINRRKGVSTFYEKVTSAQIKGGKQEFFGGMPIQKLGNRGEQISH